MQAPHPLTARTDPSETAPRIRRLMRRAELAAFLKERPRVGDGAMGAALYTAGASPGRSFDELNQRDPERVRAIHAAHRGAGAELITTNTFGANRYKLARYGLGAEVAAISAAGVEIARSAAGSEALVLGSVGPTGEVVGPFDEEAAAAIRAAFAEQVTALVEAGADALLLETFTSLPEALLALGAAREAAPQIGVLVLLTFSGQGETLLGASPERAARALADAEADAVGSNCGVGPESTLAALERMREAVELPLVAQPNAGIPARVEGRFLYPSSPDYVAHYAKRYLGLGVAMIGGCCGTGREHIAAISGVVRAASAGRPRESVPARRARVERTGAPSARAATVPASERSTLARALAQGEFVVSLEMDPPRGGGAGRFLDRARRLAGAGIRFVNIADGPRATARMSAIAFAALLERDAKVEAILHYQCRDRNLIGIQADLLGAHALGIRNLLAVTGDPPKLGDYPHATAVFDVDSVGLVRILDGLGNGRDLAGNTLGGTVAFHIGVGANPAAPDPEAEIRKFHRKREAGAHYCLTQPVYEPRLLEVFLGRIREEGVPVLVGVLPLVSSRNAEFLHNEVPGMTVPETVRARLAAAPTRERAREVGVSVAREMVRAARGLAAGVYVMPPFHRFDLALATVEGLV